MEIKNGEKPIQIGKKISTGYEVDVIGPDGKDPQIRKQFHGNQGINGVIKASE